MITFDSHRMQCAFWCCHSAAHIHIRAHTCRWCNYNFNWYKIPFSIVASRNEEWHGQKTRLCTLYNVRTSYMLSPARSYAAIQQCIRLSYCQFHSNQINSSSRWRCSVHLRREGKKSINNFEWLHSVRVDFPISPTLISVSIEGGKCAATSSNANSPMNALTNPAGSRSRIANVWVFECRAGSDKCSILFISTGIEWKCAANSYSLGIASLRPWINRNDHHLLHWI